MKKKIAISIVSLMAVLVLAFSMAACASTDFVGTYKFSAMNAKMDGVEINVKAGEDFQGVTLTEDFYTLEIKDDNTYVLTTMGYSQDGEWEIDGSELVLKDGDEIIGTGKLSGKTLTISMSAEGTLTLKKQ